MLKSSLPILGISLCLAFPTSGHAASQTIGNLTFFQDTQAGSPADVLKTHGVRLGLSALGQNLVLVKTQESLLGKHYHYQQMLHDIPVDQAEVVISIGANGKLLKIFNEAKPVSASASTQAINQMHVQSRIASETAMDRAWANMKVQHQLVATPSSKLVWVHNKNGFHLAYKVEIAAQMPTGGFVQLLAASDGRVLRSHSTSLPRNAKADERTLKYRARQTGATLDRATAMAAFAQKQAFTQPSPSTTLTSGINGQGYAFDPDPRTTMLGYQNLNDASPASAFEQAYFTRPLRDLTVTNGIYSLTGPYVSIQNIEAPNTAPSTTTNGVWTAKRGNNAFDDTNVYFHIDQNQRYIQSLGFRSILNRPIRVDTNGADGGDNSHFSGNGTTGYLAFGHGCVNDSEDADVILHEYGHAIQASINSSWVGGDTGAIGEGFGDYWAGSYSYSNAFGQSYYPAWAFTWDGHNSCWAGRFMDQVGAAYNSNKIYGPHVTITEGGVTFRSDELWSTPLFQSMIALVSLGKSRENVDRIILESHFGLGPYVTMPAMAIAVVNSAILLYPNDPTYANVFKAKFQDHNILAKPTQPPLPTTMNEIGDNAGTLSPQHIITANTTVNGTMDHNTDNDYYRLTLPAGKTVTATLTPNNTSDYDLELLDGAATNPTLLAVSAKGTGQVDVASHASNVTKIVYVRVKYYSGGIGGTNGKYTLHLNW